LAVSKSVWRIEFLASRNPKKGSVVLQRTTCNLTTKGTLFWLSVESKNISWFAKTIVKSYNTDANKSKVQANNNHSLYFKPLG